MLGKKALLTKKDQDKIVAGIKRAEQHTTGEIRLYIEANCPNEDPLRRCEEIFTNLNMHLTKQRNGVLIYLAMEDKKFAIAGDEGINKKAGGNEYWQQAADKLKLYLKEGRYAEGLSNCVEEVGKLLAFHFPADLSDTNELSDDIVFGD